VVVADEVDMATPKRAAAAARQPSSSSASRKRKSVAFAPMDLAEGSSPDCNAFTLPVCMITL